MAKAPIPAPAATREPQQDRSRASFERMLSATRKLMEKTGTTDFTLTDIAKAGKVSIGSIYLRFDSKDDLINVVHGRLLGEIDKVQHSLLATVVARSSNLREFMIQFVAEFAEMLARFAPQLRPMMARAMTDPHVSSAGARSHDAFAELMIQAMLAHAAEFGRPDHERIARASFRVVYSTLARYLGLGSSPEAAGQGNWEDIKRDLADMCTSFLIAADIASPPSPPPGEATAAMREGPPQTARRRAKAPRSAATRRSRSGAGPERS